MAFASSFISKIFGSNNSNGLSRSKAKRNAKTPRAKTLRFESLETREMLSASPISASEYANIRAQYPDFNLPAQMSSINVMELKASDLSVKNLQSKINAAEKSEQDDLIVIRTTNTANKIQYMRATDELKINLANRKAGSLTIVVTGPKDLTLDAATRCRVMTVQGSYSNNEVHLAGFTFTGGKTTGNGGGIYKYSTPLSLVNCTITNNQAGTGGGVYGVGNTNVTYKNCTITNNQAQSNGGAYGQASFDKCTIKNNKADYDAGGVSGWNCIVKNSSITNNVGRNGGGLYMSGSQIISCTISDNKSSYGGGLYCSNSTVKSCTISGNVAEYRGGGVDGYGTFISCTIKNNTAKQGSGGGALANGKFDNCTITGNTAKEYGGGLYAQNSDVLNCTISGNKAKYGGGIYGSGKFVNDVIVNNKAVTETQYNQKYGGYGGGVYAVTINNYYHPYNEFVNCTIANNSGPTSGGGVYSDGVSYFYDSILVLNKSAVKYKDCGCGKYGKANAYNTMTSQAKNLWNNASQKNVNNYVYSSSKPLFKSKTDYHLSGKDSQAYNKGYNGDVADFEVSTDRDGKTRIANGTVDLGAYEVQSTPPAKPTIASKSITASTITVTWNAVADATSYKISINGGQAVTIKKTQYKFTDLKANTSYNIKIWAVNSAGTSGSTSVPAKTKALQKLSAPEIKKTTPATQKVTIAWKAVSSAKSYTIEYWQVGSPNQKQSKTFSGTSGTITGLKANTQYKFHILTNGDGKETKTSDYGSIKQFKTTKANAKSNAILDEAFAELFNEDL